MLITVDALFPERSADCFVKIWNPLCQASLLCSDSYIFLKALDSLYFIISSDRRKQNLWGVLRIDFRTCNAHYQFLRRWGQKMLRLLLYYDEYINLEPFRKKRNSGGI